MLICERGKKKTAKKSETLSFAGRASPPRYCSAQEEEMLLAWSPREDALNGVYST
jgi:hypothetical protein